MDRSIHAIEAAVFAIRGRVAGMWPLAILGVTIVVAACGKGNGGGSGY